MVILCTFRRILNIHSIVDRKIFQSGSTFLFRYHMLSRMLIKYAVVNVLRHLVSRIQESFYTCISLCFCQNIYIFLISGVAALPVPQKSADYPYHCQRSFYSCHIRFPYAYSLHRCSVSPDSIFAFAIPIYTRNVTVINIVILPRPRIVCFSNL